MTSKAAFEKDVIPTSAGDLEITFLGHGTLMMASQGTVIHVDPYGKVADYSKLPKADLVVIGHEHGDHLDLQALAKVRTDDTAVVWTALCAEKAAGGIVMGNGDVRTVKGVRIEAVPAYNVLHKRPSGEPFHPKGHGNGYVLTFGETRVYVAGDTEYIPEMAQLQDIDVAFLPMNLPYTMTPQMVAEAARVIRPAVVYPYHFGNTDTAELERLLADEPDIEVRTRRMA
jgi:L-ascorbate metabolism protein UlaG (beta-lactamase superfamily)